MFVFILVLLPQHINNTLQKCSHNQQCEHREKSNQIFK